MNTQPTPTHKEASQWLGKLASVILERIGATNFDYSQLGYVRDAKLGVNIPLTLQKVRWETPYEGEIVGRIASYLADGPQEIYADETRFMVGLMGRTPTDAEVTPTRLREIRQALGLSQEEFSIWLGSDTPSRSGVAEWERGTRAIPYTVIEILRLKGQL